MKFTFKGAVDVKPGSEFIVCSCVRTDAHQVGQMVPVNNECLFHFQIPSICQEGNRDIEERTYRISNERSQVPSHVETCEFSDLNLDEYLCAMFYVPSWEAVMI